MATCYRRRRPCRRLTVHNKGRGLGAQRHRSRQRDERLTRTSPFIAASLLFAALAGCAEIEPASAPRLPGQAQIVVSRVPRLQLVRSAGLDSWVGPHQFKLLGDGTELEFTGGIAGGASVELAKILSDNPRIRVLQLTSQGGDTLTGMDMEKIARTRGLITYVPRWCMSSCTFVFLGGKERYIARNAQLGFHAAVGLDESPAETAKLSQATRTWMLSRGVAPDFVARAVTTPNSTVWIPTPDELLRAHVITSLTAKVSFSAPSFGPGLPGIVKQGPPQADPVYVATRALILALKKADPHAYEGMQGALYDAVGVGNYDPTRSASVSSHFDNVLQRAVAIAADDAVVSLVRARTDEMDRLATIDPAVCLNLRSVTADQQDAAMAALPPDLTVRQLTAMAAVLESSATRPQAAPSIEEARQIFRSLLENMGRVLGDEAQYLIHPDLDPRRACGLRSGIIKATLNLSEHQRSVLIRALMSGRL